MKDNKNIKIKIMHVIPRSFGYHAAEHYIHFIREHFPHQVHHFVAVGNNHNIQNNFSFPDNLLGIIYLDYSLKDFIKLLNYFLKYDKIIFHSLHIPLLFLPVILVVPCIIKKIVWVAWGYDLYEWKNRGNNFKSKIANYIARYFRKRIRYFVGVFPKDIEFFQTEFNKHALTFYAPYVADLYNPVYNKPDILVKSPNKKTDTKTVNILIGHSTSKALNHIQTLEDLSRFKNENIKIYIPLNYGDMDYGDLVQKAANDLFREKAVCLRNILDKQSYMNLLAIMDIAIFNTSRQIGLGNLYPLMFMEKKIYIPKGTVMFEYFYSLGINICDYRNIHHMDFYEFIAPVDMIKAKEYVISNVLNPSLRISQWTRVFDSA